MKRLLLKSDSVERSKIGYRNSQNKPVLKKVSVYCSCFNATFPVIFLITLYGKQLFSTSPASAENNVFPVKSGQISCLYSTLDLVIIPVKSSASSAKIIFLTMEVR